jgi:uncharacterized protein YndB with AHSA1/START domain
MPPPERLVHTFEFEGMPGHVILESLTFEEQDDKTKQVVTDLFKNIDDRDGMYKSGMEEGAFETIDRFEELLERQKSS